MAKAFKCALTGEVADGDGIKFVDVPVTETVTLRVTPFIRKDKATIVQDEIGERASAAIVEALKGIRI